jgi:hypothetical protein
VSDIEQQLRDAAHLARMARIQPEPIDIRIELDRGYFVLTKESGLLESHHVGTAAELEPLVRARIEAIELRRQRQRDFRKAIAS